MIPEMVLNVSGSMCKSATLQVFVGTALPELRNCATLSGNGVDACLWYDTTTYLLLKVVNMQGLHCVSTRQSTRQQLGLQISTAAARIQVPRGYWC